MPRRRDEYEDDVDEDQDDAIDDDEYYGSNLRGGGRSDRKRSRSGVIDDVDEEDEDEEYDEEGDEEYRGGGSSRRRGGKAAKKASGAVYFETEADVDADGEEEEEEDGEDDFIVNERVDLHDEEGARRMHHRPLLSHEDDHEDVEALERIIQERFSRNPTEFDDDVASNQVEQQALLPSIRDPKFWLVKCAIGHEREVAACLMQKCIDRSSKMQIRSVIALDHLKNYIYIEADKEAHVKEACKGMRDIYTGSKILLVPTKEMTDVLSVESKSTDLSRGTLVRIKIGIYKGDLAKVVDVDNVRHKVTVKLIPRIDLQALANKLDGREAPKKKTLIPPQRIMNVDEAREMNIRVEHRRDRMTGDYFDNINGMMFKNGFLYKTVSIKSIRTQNIQPSFDELENFRQFNENGDGNGDISSLSNRKKGNFMKGDRVIIVEGDLKKLKGLVEKVEEHIVHIKPDDKGLPKTLAVSERQLCKYFETGNHVKVVSGAQEGVTGMVLRVEGHLVNIMSDTTKQEVQVFSDNVVVSSEVTSGTTKMGIFGVHDLVQMNNLNFGVIIRVDNESCQVLKGVADRADVELVRLREIKHKIDKKMSAHDRCKNAVSVNDVVKVMEGPRKGRQGRVEHIYRGFLFIYNCHHLEHAGYICAKSQSCALVGGSHNRNGNLLASRVAQFRTPTHLPPRGGPPLGGGRYRGKDSLVGTCIKIRVGPFKGYKGRVIDVHGTSIRVELESQMKVVTVDRSHIYDNENVKTANRETNNRYGSGSETPMHPSQTPLHPYMTPMREPGATPIHEGMRTPMHDGAWNPYTSISPPRMVRVE